MTHRWDEFSKSLAEESLPRRESLRRLGIFVVAAALSPLGLKPAFAGPNSCKNFCRCKKKKQQAQCLAACKACDNRPQDLCGSCGSYFCCGTAACCGDYCADLDGDFYNCGECGFVCEPAGQYEQGTCIDGGCAYACVQGAIVCDGECTPINWDPDNCGACGNVCEEPTPYCNQGLCSECLPGWGKCDGECIDLTFDNGNCGACGVFCSTEETCVGGHCEPTPPYYPE